jgi:hypothetical protein
MRRALALTLLLAGCHHSIHMSTTTSVTVTHDSQAKEECSRIHDEAERKVCLDAVELQRKIDRK